MSYQSALTDPDFRTPGSTAGLWDVFKQRYLLSLLLRKGITTRYYGSVLGWVWSYIRPAAQFLMYFLVIGILLGANRGMDYFPVYLFAGIITVNLFSEALRNATGSITDNSSLIKKIYLPRELFPVSAVGVSIIHFLPQAVVLLVVTLMLGWTVTWLQIAAFVVSMILIVTFALGLGLFFGAINVAFRDARNVVDIILMFSTWASPVLYSSELVRELAPSWLYHVYMSNPVTVGVELMHNVFWLPLTPGSERPSQFGVYILVGAAVSVITLVIGQITFRKLEGNFVQHL